MRLKNLILILTVLTKVVVLAACGTSGQSGGNDQGNQEKVQNEQQAQQEPPEKQVAPERGTQESEGVPAVDPPSKDMFKLTIPQMDRIRNDEIPTGLGTDETLFHDYAAVHLKN